MDIGRAFAITLVVNQVIREARATLLLAVPIAIGQVGQMLMGVTDSVMLGRLGTVPLAASAFGVGIFNIFFIIGVGLLTPVAIFASRSRGAGLHDEAGEYLRHGLALGLCTAAAEAALVWFLSLHLGWFRQPAEVTAAVNPFFFLIGLSLVPVLAYLAMRQFAEAMGHPWVPVLIVAGGVLLNILLNWVFIYGHLGAPAMGLTGSGVSTLVSRTLGSVVIFAWMRLDPGMRAAWPARWAAPLSSTRMRRMLDIGLPASGCLLFESGAFAAATVMMGWLGAEALAAHQIALSCAAMTFMVALGLSMAVGMRISRAAGAGEHQRMRPIWVGGISMGLVLSLSIMAAFLAFGRPIASFFISEPRVVSIAATLLGVAAVFQVFDVGQVIHSASLRSIVDVRIPAAITFVAYWLVALPVGYALGIHTRLGPAGIWTGLAAGLALAAVLLGARFLRLTRPGGSGA